MASYYSVFCLKINVKRGSFGVGVTLKIMADIHRLAMAENDLAPAEAVVARDAQISELIKRMAPLLVAAVMPVLGSCGGQVDAEEEVSDGPAVSAGVNNEEAEKAGKVARTVALWTDDGGHWTFQGNYPADEFKLVVSADGKEISAQDVKVDHAVSGKNLAQFFVAGGYPEKTAKIHLDAFNVDGSPIPIGNGAKGMIGVPDFVLRK